MNERKEMLLKVWAHSSKKEPLPTMYKAVGENISIGGETV